MAGGRVEIVRGLALDEGIVVSSNFLIDSESKLQLAAAGMQTGLVKDPVSGAQVSMRKAAKSGRIIHYGGKIFYFSSEESRDQFIKEPGRYTEAAAQGIHRENTTIRQRRPKNNRGRDQLLHFMCPYSVRGELVEP